MNSTLILPSICILAAVLFSSSHSAPTFRSKRSSFKRSDSASIEAITHTVEEGHNIELECSATGPSPPVIHWLFNGVHINQGPLDHMSENILPPLNPGERMSTSSWGHEYTSKSTLVVRHVNLSDSGEYTCVADLPGNRTTETYNVVVQSSAEHTLEQILHPEKRSEPRSEDTRIYLYTDSVYEFEGVSTLLMCRATQGPNKPTPAIHWTIDDVPVTADTSDYQVRENGDLVIPHTSFMLHLAFVKCIAVGEGGKTDEKEPFIYLFEPEK